MEPTVGAGPDPEALSGLSADFQDSTLVTVDGYLRLPQNHETVPLARQAGPFSYRCAYSRSAEAQLNGEPGEDYLAVWQRHDALGFCLCDGVGQSFFGGLAARLLGEALLSWLEDVPDGFDEHIIRERLSYELAACTETVSRTVQSLSLPGDLPPLLRDVLEDKRRLGSETTFACGRFDLASDWTAGQGRAILAWIGDSRVRLWEAGRERFAELGERFASAAGWSSKHGSYGGQPRVFVEPLSRAGRWSLVAYSDGLAELDALDGPPPGDVLGRLIATAQAAPTSDDIAYFEVRPAQR